MIKYIDLFAGVGGFHLGLQNASPEFECVYSNEWDKYANSTYKKHFGECDDRDIREVKAEELPEFDLLCGGFPCQSFSIAGKRGGFNDTRGTLFFEIARIVKQRKPRLLLLENVKGLLSHDKGNTFTTIISTLDELGYDCQWQVLNSKNFGVPQNRERVFIVGHLRETPRPQVFPIIGQSEGSLDYLGGILSDRDKWIKDEKDYSRNFSQGQRVYKTSGIGSTLAGNAGGLGGKTGLYAMTETRSDEARSIRREAMKSGRDWSPRRGKVLVPRTDDKANTVTSGQSKEHLLSDGVKIRRLTPKECERLQGFPDGWTEGLSDTQRYKCLGNAVTTNVITEIGKLLVDNGNKEA